MRSRGISNIRRIDSPTQRRPQPTSCLSNLKCSVSSISHRVPYPSLLFRLDFELSSAQHIAAIIPPGPYRKSEQSGFIGYQPFHGYPAGLVVSHWIKQRWIAVTGTIPVQSGGAGPGPTTAYSHRKSRAARDHEMVDLQGLSNTSN